MAWYIFAAKMLNMFSFLLFNLAQRRRKDNIDSYFITQPFEFVERYHHTDHSETEASFKLSEMTILRYFTHITFEKKPVSFLQLL